MGDVLTARDRCDTGGCNATAYVMTGALLWCVHHYTVHAPALAAQGFTVHIDERHRLTGSVEKAKREGVS